MSILSARLDRPSGLGTLGANRIVAQVLDPGPLPDFDAAQRRLERARFALMAAAFDHGTLDAATSGAIADLDTQIFDALDGPAFQDRSAATEFLAAQSLFTLLACRDQTDRPLRPEKITPLLDQHCPIPDPSDDPLKLSARNNHLLMKALPRALLAAQIDRSQDAAQSPAPGQTQQWADTRALHDRYLAGIAVDGLPLEEAVRGASAAWYINLAVMLLTTLEWIVSRAQVQLASRAPSGAGLVDMVQALARVIDDPTQLHRWCRHNMYPHAAHGSDPFDIDLGFVGGYSRSRHYLAWIPLFTALYGALALPAPLAKIWSDHGDYFPRGNDFIGGFVALLVDD